MLVLDKVTIATPHRVLVRGLDAAVEPGRLLVVMGESGAGKSSLLGFLAGMLPDGFTASGAVHLDGRRIDTLPTAQRRVALLFQDDLLFPHMRVIENLLFALPALTPTLSRAGEGRGEGRRAQAEGALRLAGLDGYGPRWPHELSGGQRARVSVLRALLAQPRAVLLDEPFSRLDMPLRTRFRQFVFERIADQRIPALLVTHDPADVPAGAPVIELKPDAPDA